MHYAVCINFFSNVSALADWSPSVFFTADMYLISVKCPPVIYTVCHVSAQHITDSDSLHRNLFRELSRLIKAISILINNSSVKLPDSLRRLFKVKLVMRNA